MQLAGGELSLTYQKDVLRGGITWQVEVSTDLQTWTPVPDVLVDSVGYLQTRKATVPMGSDERKFVRLAIGP